MRKQDRSKLGGAITVELALTVNLLILMMVGAADFSRIFFNAITVGNASGTASFFGSQDAIKSVSFSSIDGVVTDDTADVEGVSSTPTLYCDCPDTSGSGVSGSGTTGRQVDCIEGDCGAYGAPRVYSKVKVQQMFEPLLPWPGVPNPVVLTRETYTRVR